MTTIDTKALCRELRGELRPSLRARAANAIEELERRVAELNTAYSAAVAALADIMTVANAAPGIDAPAVRREGDYWKPTIDAVCALRARALSEEQAAVVAAWQAVDPDVRRNLPQYLRPAVADLLSAFATPAAAPAEPSWCGIRSPDVLFTCTLPPHDGPHGWEGGIAPTASPSAGREVEPSDVVRVTSPCKCGLKTVPSFADAVSWYWQRHTRDQCTLELPNERCWCGRLRSEHMDGHDESQRNALTAALHPEREP